MIDLFISGLPTGTIDSMKAVIPMEIGMPSSPSTIQASLSQVATFLGVQGFIAENAGQLTYITGTSYRVEAGSAIVNGSLLTWGSPITRSGLTFTSGTMNYVYLYDNAGTPAAEESTTVPDWDSTFQYWKKSGDETRRCIGFLQAQTVNTIRMFVNIVKGRESSFIYIDGQNPVSGKRVVTAGAASSWTSFSLAPLVPTHATDFLCGAKIQGTAANDEATLGLSPTLMSAAANFAPFTMRFAQPNAGGASFVLPPWLEIKTSQTYYYRLLQNTGTGSTVLIDVQGAKIIR